MKNRGRRTGKARTSSSRTGFGRRRHARLVWQLGPLHCGPTCLLMLLRARGARVSRREIEASIPVTSHGSTALALSEFARLHGANLVGARVPVDLLRECPLPAILHWGTNHYVVLSAATDSHATI